MNRLWRINCMEHVYPGMWQRWFKNQCAAVGWSKYYDFRLNGDTKKARGWSTARNRLKEMKLNDYVIVTLRRNRVGRLGQITSMAVGDDEWSPLVPKNPANPSGEMG
ncbi:MAG: hypothetical protein ACP5OA_03135, partial [Candidatus Woesearchaeota archaeon]